MIKYPKNFEEAKVIIKNSTEDDLTKKIEKASRLKAIFFTGLGATVATTLFQISGGNPWSLIVGIPLAVAACAPSIIKHYLNLKVKRNIKNGKYFEGKTEQEIIDKATEYTEIFNEYEDNKIKEIEEKHR